MKKIISIVMMLAIVLSIGVVSFASADSRGNVNGDDKGEITLTDAMITFRYCAKVITIEDFEETYDPLAMDINQDYSVTLADAMAIFKYVAKVDMNFPEFNNDFDYDRLAENLGIK